LVCHPPPPPPTFPLPSPSCFFFLFMLYNAAFSSSSTFAVHVSLLI
jgi:hypothetical protein